MPDSREGEYVLNPSLYSSPQQLAVRVKPPFVTATLCSAIEGVFLSPQHARLTTRPYVLCSLAFHNKRVYVRLITIDYLGCKFYLIELVNYGI